LALQNAAELKLRQFRIYLVLAKFLSGRHGASVFHRRWTMVKISKYEEGNDISEQHLHRGEKAVLFLRKTRVRFYF